MSFFRSHKALTVVAWIIAIGLVFTQGLYLFYAFMPISHWIEYRSITPLNEEVCVDDTIKFVTESSVYHPVGLRFNDILYCRDRNTNEYERYNEQNTRRSLSVPGVNRLTVWPFNPGVAYPTTCYLESNVTLRLPLHENRSFRYDGLAEGQEFTIRECE